MVTSLPGSFGFVLAWMIQHCSKNLDRPSPAAVNAGRSNSRPAGTEVCAKGNQGSIRLSSSTTALGNPSGTAEVTRLVGTIAALTITDDPQGEFSIVNFTFEHHLAPPTLQLWPVSLIQGPDRPDLGPTQPVFSVLSLEGSLAARPGEPVLAASAQLSSEVDPSPGGPRRALLFVTLEPTAPR